MENVISFIVGLCLWILIIHRTTLDSEEKVGYPSQEIFTMCYTHSTYDMYDLSIACHKKILQE